MWGEGRLKSVGDWIVSPKICPHGNPQRLRKESASPPEPSEGAWPCWHLDFWLPSLRTVGESASVVLATQFVWFSYSCHREAKGIQEQTGSQRMEIESFDKWLETQTFSRDRQVKSVVRNENRSGKELVNLSFYVQPPNRHPDCIPMHPSCFPHWPAPLLIFIAIFLSFFPFSLTYISFDFMFSRFS